MGMEKKLEAARKKGFDEGMIDGMQMAQRQVESAYMDGVKVGADAMNLIWIEAVENTKGIGPTIMKRIVEAADAANARRLAEAKQNQEVQA